MKPSAFEYFAPGTVAEAIALLQQYGDDAKILAGGQSLVPMMNFRVARPEVLVDLNRVGGLDEIRQEGEQLHLGALVRHSEVEYSPLVRDKCPVLTEAVSQIGHAAIRNRGTIGGSLAHADPSAEIATTLLALDGELRIAGSGGERIVKADEFFVSYLTTSLEPSEVLVEARFPVLPPRSGWSFLELSRRHGDFAMVAVAVLLTMEDAQTCARASIALGGVAPTPIRAGEAEALLAGQAIGEELIERAGESAARACDPDSDYHGSAEYRRHLAKVFTRRGLEAALQSFKKGNRHG